MKAITAAKAREKMAEAEQALAKRSFFKAAPDYFTAESKFKQAAMDFKTCGEPENAVDAFVRAADCAERNRDKFNAAAHLEAAANLAQSHRATVKGMKEKALELFDRACVLYSETDNKTGAIEVKFRIGKSLYQGEPEQAAKFLLQACQLIDTTRNDAVAIDVFALAINAFVRQRQLATALEQVLRFSDLCRRIGRRDQLFKNNLTQTILMCAMGDFAGANQAFMDHVQDDDYLSQVEAATAEDMIEAFTKHDALKLKQVQAGRGLKFLENEVAKFAGAMTMGGDGPGPGGGPPPAAGGGGGAPAAAAASAAAAKPGTQHGDLASFTADGPDTAKPAAPEAAPPPSLPRPADANPVRPTATPAPAPAPAPARAPAPAPAPAPAGEHDSDDDIFA